MDIFYPEARKLLVVKKLVHASFQRSIFKVVFFVLLTMTLSFSVKADYTIPVNTIVDAATINTQSGTLHIYGTLRVNSDVLFNSPNPISIILYGPAPGGGIEWTANKVLAFPAGTTINFVNAPRGLAGGGNSASAILQIGTVQYAAANDNSNNVLFSFAQINAIGGTASVITSATSTYCAGDSIHLKANTSRPTSSLYKVKWKTQSNLGTFSVNDTSTAVNTVLSGIPAGTEVITCELFVNGNNNNNQINYILAARSTMSMNVKAKNTWLGASNNWNDPQNWCPQLPSGATDLTIPVMANNIYPIIGSSTASVKNLTIATGASVIVNGTGVLEISGTIVNNGTLNATSGTLRFNGTTAQTIAGSNFLNRTLENLTVSNPAGLNISAAANDTLSITGTVAFGHANATLNTGNNLVLKSSASATANVGQLGANNNIVGNVTVERSLYTGRKWRLLSVPTQRAGQTIRNSWQEGGSNVSGYGFKAFDTRADFAIRGFDALGSNTSVQKYSPATNTWGAVDNTHTSINAERGYLVFVAGDFTASFPNSNATKLRTSGQLFTGTQTPITIDANKFTLIGNPYASSINLKNLNFNGDPFVAEAVYVWDPSATNNYGVGNWLTLVKNLETGDYENLLPSQIYGGFGTVNNFIESGQAFFVRGGTTTSTITFDENDKTSEGRSTASSFTAGASQSIKAILNLVPASGSPIALDGVKADFGENYSNNINGYDIRKMGTLNESVSWKTKDSLLVVDRRAMIVNNDTLHLNNRNYKVQNYQWQIISTNLDFPGRTGFIIDRYTGTVTPLDMAGTTTINFSVQNIVGSYASDRFKIVFNQVVASPLPVTITTVTAIRSATKSNEIMVSWKVEEEMNMENYMVEISTDGSNFNSIGSVGINNSNNGSGTYSLLNDKAAAADHFYRIRANSIGGQIQYSAVVKVAGIKTNGSSISVYPNPVVDKKMNVQFAAGVAGKYQLTLFDNNGSRAYQQALKLNSNSSIQTIELPSNLAAGMYQLRVQTPNGKMEQQALFVL